MCPEVQMTQLLSVLRPGVISELLEAAEHPDNSVFTAGQKTELVILIRSSLQEEPVSVGPNCLHTVCPFAYMTEIPYQQPATVLNAAELD